MTPPPASWQVHRLVGEAGDLHARPLPPSLPAESLSAPSPSERPRRELWLCEVTRPALVLGSSARQQDFVNRDLARRRGVDVVHRRSGGAAVLLEPGAQLWADVVIGRDDPLWHDDIGRAAWWVGEWWRRALARFGVSTTVHQGKLRGGDLARRICFAGVGPGEVLADGRKLVGLSQRRTRDVARLQTVMLLQWQPGGLAELCGLRQPADAPGSAAPADRGPADPVAASPLGPGVVPAEPGRTDPVDTVGELAALAVGLEELMGQQHRKGVAPGPDGLGSDGLGPDGIGPDGIGPDGAGPQLLAQIEAALIEELPRL